MRQTETTSPQASNAIPAKGFVRLAAIIAPHGPLPISRSTWFAWRRAGKAPAPVLLSARITAYRAEDVQALISKLDGREA